VPGGSELVDIEGVDRESIASQIGEHNTEVFSAYFVLSPGDEHTVTFIYQLPAWITPESYRLVVQRQAGANPYPFSAVVGDQRYENLLTEGLTYLPF
jgi:hypothetical protein